MKKLILILLLIPISALAVKYEVNNATITEIKITKDWSGGGCLIRVPAFTDKGSCLNEWLSLQCDEGNYSRPDNARMMLDVAHIAQALDKKVNIVVNHASRLRWFCIGNGVRSYELR